MPQTHPADLSLLQQRLGAASTPAAQLLALRTQAGLYVENPRTFFACTGPDRLRWLNGLVTNHVGALAEHRGCYAFVLNAQGRIQGDLNIYAMGDSLWLETASEQAAKLFAYLERYIIMDDVTLAPLPAQDRLCVAGPQAATVLASIGISVADMEPLQIRTTLWKEIPVTLTAEFHPLVPLYTLSIATEQAESCAHALLGAGALACNAEAVEQLRILAGIPRYGIDFTDRELPQETGQERALHFSKGCYLGQEIVERIRSRGNVHRVFSGFIVEDSAAVFPGVQEERLPILAGDQQVGELTSTTAIDLPDGSRKAIALGYIRREALDKKMELNCSGHSVYPEDIPFSKIL